MRDLRALDAFRITEQARLCIYGGWAGDETCGAFEIKSPVDGNVLLVIASNGEGWDHVSVSRRNRCPTWAEMDHVAGLFFKDGEYAMQLHVPRDKHLNLHANCLHWWRPHSAEIPLPPSEFVAVPGTIADNVAYMKSR